MKITTVAFWPDDHDPDYDVIAAAVAEDIVCQAKPDIFCFTGDFHDLYGVSQYPKNPSKMFQSLDQEIAPGIERRNRIVQNSGAKKVIYLLGNHEMRLKNYIQKNAPLIAPSISLKHVLRIPYKWKVIPYDKRGFWHMGPLSVCHGFYTNKYCIQKHIEEFKTDILFGHTHRVGSSTANRLMGGPVRGYNIGCLIDFIKGAEYCNAPQNWMHAITLGYFTEKYYSICIIPIVNGRAIFNGRVFKNKKGF